MNWRDIRTPALFLDLAVLDRNLATMAERAATLGVTLRPHIKTHKCVEVARRQQRAGARGFTVSTLAEARAFIAAGFDDLTWALPLAPQAIPGALETGRGVTLRLVLDDEAAAAALESAAARCGVRPHVWLKVDCGYHRAGVDPGSSTAAALARRLADSPHVVFDGLLTHAGHSYHAFDTDERLSIARAERDVTVAFAARLRGAGVGVPAVSVGSTPTVTIVDHLEGVAEVRPGNYAYFDLTQAALGACRTEDIAVSVLATVVSHPPGADRVVVDAGALALSKDTGPPAGGMGMGAVCPDPEGTRPDRSLRLASLSQEHGVIRAADGAALDGRLPVGARVRILPNHSCLTNACFDAVHVLNAGELTAIWKVHRDR